MLSLRLFGTRVSHRASTIIPAIALLAIAIPARSQAGEPAVTARPGVYYLHRNTRGDGVLVTDRAGTPLATMEYGAFGARRRESPGMPFGYAGQRHDRGGQLVYMHARYYAEDLGRFLGADPERESASPFGYVLADPATFTDPDGRCVICRRLWPEHKKLVRRQRVRIVAGLFIKAENLGRDIEQLERRMPHRVMWTKRGYRISKQPNPDYREDGSAEVTVKRPSGTNIHRAIGVLAATGFSNSEEMKAPGDEVTRAVYAWKRAMKDGNGTRVGMLVQIFPPAPWRNRIVVRVSPNIIDPLAMESGYRKPAMVEVHGVPKDVEESEFKPSGWQAVQAFVQGHWNSYRKAATAAVKSRTSTRVRGTSEIDWEKRRNRVNRKQRQHFSW